MSKRSGFNLKLRVPEQVRGLDTYARSKALDGYPDREWTYNLFASRSVMLASSLFASQYFYESLSAYDQVLGALVLNERLRDQSVPEWALMDIGIGLKVFDSFIHSEAGRLQLPTEEERFRGRHSVALVGWEDGGDSLIFRNSWGQEWGDGGYGYLSRDWFDAHVDEAHVRRSVTVGQTQSTFPEFAGLNSDEQIAGLWMLKNPYDARVVYLNDETHTVIQYATTSFWRGGMAEVIELRNKRGERVAWMHLFHEADDVTVVREFFVPPWNRRRGYGTWLAAIAVSQAKWRGSDRIVVTMDEADSLLRNRSGAICFWERQGFSWLWASRVRPNQPGYAERLVTPNEE
jgi:GNAT superfamily N-acetyltransferase